MATTYEPFVKVKKLPAKIDVPTSWGDQRGSDVRMTIDSASNKIHLNFSEHDDELDFIREFNSFLGNLKKKTKVIAIDFGGLEEDFEITKMFKLEGHILISLDEAKKRLQHIPIDNKGRLRNIGQETEIKDRTYIG